MNDAAAVLDRLIAKAGHLYSLPAVAMKVLELTSNPRVDIRALEECIENDPALTVKILRVVNSSLFGLSRDVSDLNQALALLGSKPLKLLVLGFSLPAGLFAGVEKEILGRYWRHTLTKAVAAREVSENLFGIPGDEAFIAGLLQDLGVLLLIQQVGGAYATLLNRVHAAGKDLAALETASLGFDHTTVSARLLAHWGLPESLVDAVARQSGDGQSDGRARATHPLPQILHLAELIARLLADGRNEALGELLEAGRAYQNLSEAQLETALTNLEEKVRQLADVLSLQLPDGLDYRDVLANAHARLADVAFEAAEDLLPREHGDGQPSEEQSLLAEIRQLAEAVASTSARPNGPTESASPPGVLSSGPQPTTSPPAPAAVGQPGIVGPATAAAEPELLERLAMAVAACRQSRCPLSLLLVQLDTVDEMTAAFIAGGLAEVQRLLETACQRGDCPSATCVAHGAAGFALVLPDCERRTAVELGSQVVGEICRPAPGSAAWQHRGVSASVGVATVALLPKNFPPQDLLAAAERCLYGSYASGGGVVKSIEI